MQSRSFSKNTMEERKDIFFDYFDRDLEHYFDSRIACCEKCYDEFCSEWPGTAARDERFQTSGIEISYFLRESRIQDAFYPEEIAHFAKELTCPNCGSVLDGEFYIFEHPFKVDKFHIGSIAKLAQTSPFLLLTHPFAAKVLDVIQRRAATAPVVPVETIWFRGRLARDVAAPELKDFGPPPASKVAEGRYNHAGHSMLYVADSPLTVWVEMRCSEPVHVAKLELNMSLKLLNLSVSDDVDGEDDEVIQCLARSALCAAPRTSDGWDRPEYVFSRFVADCARHGGYGAIRYGSVQDSRGSNMVVLDPPVDFSTVASLMDVTTSSRAPHRRCL